MDKLAFLISEGVKNLWRHKLTAITAIFSVFITLFLIGSLFIVTQNSHHLIEYLRTKYKIEVFFKEEVTNKQAREIMAAIKVIPGVRSTTLITKEDALRIFKDQFGEDIVALLGYNPLPASCVVNINRKQTDMIDIQPIISKIKSLKGVDQVNYQGRLIRRIERFYQKIVRGVSFVVIIVLLLTIIIISNTIKLTIHAKQDLIKALKLLGATNLFIKVPFLLEAVFQGLIGAGLALIALIGVIQVGNTYLGKLFHVQVQYDPLLGPIMVGFAILIGLLTGHRTVTKYLK